MPDAPANTTADLNADMTAVGSASTSMKGNANAAPNAAAEGAPPVRCFGLVPCAGTGSRAGAALPKQYVVIDGAPVVEHTLRALAAVDRLVLSLVALAPDDHRFDAVVTLPPAGRFATARCGGPTRAATVAAGLAALRDFGARAEDWVLVHDAARCLVRAASIDALIDACLGDRIGGLLALPVADTLKHEREGRAASTLPRRHVWQAQTPQMFRLGVLAEALALAEKSADAGEVTDEAGAIERLGLEPRLVPGRADNLKVTHGDDLLLAEQLLKARR